MRMPENSLLSRVMEHTTTNYRLEFITYWLQNGVDSFLEVFRTLSSGLEALGPPSALSSLGDLLLLPSFT